MATNAGGRPPGLIPDGPKIRQMRKERGMSSTDLARAIGRSRPNISGIENHNWPVAEPIAYRIVHALNRAGREVGMDEPDVKLEDILADGDEDERRLVS